MLPRSLSLDKLDCLIEIVRDTSADIEAALFAESEIGIVDLQTRQALWHSVVGVFGDYLENLGRLSQYARSSVLAMASREDEASLLLWTESIEAAYLFAKFDCVYENGPEGRGIKVSIHSLILKQLRHAKQIVREPRIIFEIEGLINGAVQALRNAKERFDQIAGPRVRDPSILFVTALEYEFQSIVRRFDTISECTSKRHYGFNLDLRIEEETRDLRGERSGWAVGTLNGAVVAVICAGKYGAENVNSAVENFLSRCTVEGETSLSPTCWCVVGVCAATSDREARLGDIVLSNAGAFHVEAPRRRPQDPWRFQRWLRVQAPPAVLPDLTSFTKTALFIGAPPRPHDAEVAELPVKVFLRRFLISDEVIDSQAERSLAIEAVRDGLSALRTAGGGSLPSKEAVVEPGEDEWFGVEMEGVGLLNRPVLIVKSVVDYADERSKGVDGWDQSLKRRIHWYAAEVAAETVSRLVPSLLSRVDAE